MPYRQPSCSDSQAANGRNRSWPVALLAPSIPMIRPRRLVNQRVAIVAPSTLAVAPVERPIITPHVNQSCHTAVILVAKARPITINARAVPTTVRTPYLSMTAAANGAAIPYSRTRSARAPEMAPRSQPNSVLSGRGLEVFALFHQALTREAARSRPPRLKWSHLLNPSAITVRRYSLNILKELGKV